MSNAAEYNRAAEAMSGSVRIELPGDVVALAHFSTRIENGFPITSTYMSLHRDGKEIASDRRDGIVTYIAFTGWCARHMSQHLTATPARGHMFFVSGLEYFETPDGNVYRAPAANPLAYDGFRMGARFECTRAAVPQLKALLHIS